MTRKPWKTGKEWLPNMDLNHDKQIQSLLCYRYTIRQTVKSSLLNLILESSLPGAFLSHRLGPGL
jgi:hypothetical protein